MARWSSVWTRRSLLAAVLIGAAIIPGYANGNRPFGTFTARSLLYGADYVSTAGNANWDFGFAVVGTVNSRTLVDTVGAEGIAFNSTTGQHVHSFGYGGSAAEGSGR